MNMINDKFESKSKFVAYLLLILNCLSPMAAIVIAPSLPQMQKEFSSIPNVEFLVPIALTIPGLLVALLSPVVGLFADKYGRKKMLVTATFVYSLIGVLPLFLHSLYAIIGSRVVLGMAEAVIVTLSTTLIGDYYSGAVRQRYLALQTTFASSSAILFFIIGGVLGEFGWRVPYVVYAVPVVLGILGAFMLWEPKQQMFANDDNEVEVVTFKPKLLFFICIVTCIGALAFMILQIQMAFILGAIGETSPKVAGNISSACSALIVVGTLSVHVFSRMKFKVGHNLFIAFGLIGLSFLLMSQASSADQVLLYSLLNGFGCGLLLPTLAIWNMKNLPWYKRGIGTGMWYGSYCLGMFFSPILFVTITKFTGNLFSTLSLAGWLLIPLALIALAFGFLKVTRQPAATTTIKHG
ncbi:MFS transporter [Acinetobacter baumannii]|nr:MFS transporter [Acinetobacter baumannii]